MQTAPMSGVPVTLQAALTTTGNGTVIAIPPSFTKHTITIKAAAGAVGAVQIETADAADYSGTWAQIGGGPTTVVAAAELALQFEGVYQFIRARVSTNITTGTIAVSYIGSRN